MPIGRSYRGDHSDRSVQHDLAHGPREQVSVPEIVEVTRALVLAVLRTVGTK
ncbi:hypothetical protein [Actinacidiphila oryziradicis]|uniref:hypothetical protein n=1 Tax=Actinacidiphila oryziradicis TaxID=2571141 RepID=UPI0023F2C446|nr:hypothetical protein [Actinacidiphila oryziradicis]